MTANETTPNPVARVGVADVFSSAALDTRKYSAPPRARQVGTPARSILSIDDGTAAPRAAAWLARRGRISLAHAAALAEVNGLGGVA